MRKIVELINDRGWKFCFDIFFTFFKSMFVYNKQIFFFKKDIIAYHSIKKYYSPLFKTLCQYVEKKQVDSENIIWICWFQGIENAPLIIKKCINSIAVNNPTHHVVIIADDNIEQYISLPEYIIEKRRKGIISLAHYSDLVRLNLLLAYGGTWIDATVFMTGSFPGIVKMSDVFFFQLSQMSTYNVIRASNWFIYAAKKNNILLNVIYNTLLSYWCKNNCLYNYFLFHIVLSYVVDNDNECNKIFRKIPFACNMEPHLLQHCLFDQYNKCYWDYIMSITSVHKLTYKIEDLKSSEVNTYYKKIMQ